MRIFLHMQHNSTMKKAHKTATFFGCTPQQAEAQMKRNLVELGEMLGKAQTTGRLVNGYDAAQLRDMIAKVKKGWNL